MKKVVIANDHGAVELSARFISFLKEEGYEVTYLGTAKNEAVDYPDMAQAACLEYLKGGYEFGILCCGSGIGISISANKINGIRCALPQDIYAAEKCKEHNNANFIAFGGRIEYKEDPLDMLKAYMKMEASTEPRHLARIDKMMALEKN
ncbi:MAG: RpiB/LacA/LacB family sugar-phosphate isomerase [Sphaerochaetaceae bacterium]|nr:RpiB/LacA/LacB family sugar-phosphate isomerase [Sphaerochaetaceae bacterium]